MSRWPIIRHIRWWVKSRRNDSLVQMWAMTGVPYGVGFTDTETLDAIWRGAA